MSRRYAQYADVIEVSPDELTEAQIARMDGNELVLGLPFLERLYDPLDGVVGYNVAFDEQSRPDILAWKLYKDAYKWEDIMDFNNIDDPIGELLNGKQLLIPTNPNRIVIRPDTYAGVE